MKRNIFLFVILNLFQYLSLSFGEGWGAAFSQNLVPNPSFEIIDTCEFNNATSCENGVYNGFAPPWDTPTNGTSDIFNTCSLLSGCSVPSNDFGFQYAHTGNGYVGGYYYQSFSNGREYIQTPLDSILKPQHKYCVNFYVNLANYATIASNKMGMYFSTTYTSAGNNTIFNLTPQILDTTIIIDTANWTLISGQYIAQGGEQYIIIGNFNTNATIDTTVISGNGVGSSYYYVDDVSIEDCTTVGVLEELAIKNNELKVMPNPATDKITVETPSFKFQVQSLKVINVIGEIVKQLKMDNGQLTIDVGDLTNGVYFVEVENEKGVNRKVVVQ